MARTIDPPEKFGCDEKLEAMIISLREFYQQLNDVSEAEQPARVRKLRVKINAAQEEFASSIYSRLYGLTCSLVKPNSETPTMGPTAIVNEAFTKLLRAKSFERSRDLNHFMSQFAIAVKHSIISYWRKKNSRSRGGDWNRCDFDIALDFAYRQNGDLNRLFSSIDQLDDEFPRASRVLHLRYFLLMKNKEIAEILSISKSTVEADLRLAKAVVRSQLENEAIELYSDKASPVSLVI